MKKSVISLVLVLAATAALVAGMVLIAPTETTAQTYSAGNKTVDLCFCPVLEGDCVCVYLDPPKK